MSREQQRLRNQSDDSSSEDTERKQSHVLKTIGVFLTLAVVGGVVFALCYSQSATTTTTPAPKVGAILPKATLTTPIEPTDVPRFNFKADPARSLASYKFVPVSQNLQVHETICSPAIVLKMCTRLNRYTRSYFKDAFDSDNGVVHSAEISEQLAASRKSVQSFLVEIGATNLVPVSEQGPPLKEFAVSCQDLCEKVVTYFPDHVLPSRSNVGCYYQGTGGPKCSIDLAEETLKTFASGMGSGGGPHAGFVVHGHDTALDRVDKIEEQALHGASDPSALPPTALDLLEELQEPKVPFHRLALDLANMFYIYPPISDEVEKATVVGSRRLADDGGSLGFALDSLTEPEPVVETAQCPPTICTTDATCTCHFGGTKTVGIMEASGETCYICAGGLKARDLPWQESALQTAAQAQGVVSVTLNKMNSREIPDQIIKWYGNNEPATRTEVKRLLNGVNHLLSNSVFQMGDQCQPNVYAYVYPNNGEGYTNNAQGQKIINLCAYYFKVGQGEKVGTLVHEGSHHLSMNTDDVKADSGPTMYGRNICSKVASQCKAGEKAACAKVLRNADNFDYLIEDMLDGHGSGK